MNRKRKLNPDAVGSTPAKKGPATAADDHVSAVRTRRLMKELQALEIQSDPVCSVELVNDSLFEWNVHLKRQQIDADSDLAAGMRKLNIPHILLHLKFPDTFPFAPPFMRIVEPVIEADFVMGGGALCMDLLTPSGWASTYSVEAVLMQFAATVVKGRARVSKTGSARAQYSLSRAEESFKFVVQSHGRHGWHTPKLSDG